MLKFIYNGVLFQEVPTEISLGFTLLGCPHKCEGCHSQQYWKDNVNPALGADFSANDVKAIYSNTAFPDHKNATCLCFFGGDWDLEYFLDEIFKLRHFMFIGILPQLKLAWYTGLTWHDFTTDDTYKIEFLFDYIKYGKYDKDKGALDSKSTNQVMAQRNFEDITYLFQYRKDGDTNEHGD